MNYVVRFIGIVIGCLGIVHLTYPDMFQRVIEFLKQEKRIYYVALIRLTFGAIFLLGARESRIPWVIVVFGVLFILKGLVIFMLGPAKIKSKYELWQNKSNLLIRVLALVALALGFVVIYSA